MGVLRKLDQIAVLKTLSWRVVATLDTFIVASLVTGQTSAAGALASVEVVIKSVLYFLHDEMWFRAKGSVQSMRISVIKSFTWRLIASSTTVVLGLLVFGNAYEAVAIGLFEMISKMLIYIGHERVWNYLIGNYFNGELEYSQSS